MPGEGGTTRPVKTRALLIDPASLTVSWMNEAAVQSLVDREAGFTPGMSAEVLVAMAGTQEVAAAIERVARSGEARHLQINLVSTRRGSVTIETSIYKLPDGMLLVLSDNAWQAKDALADDRPSRHPTRRRRSD